MSSKRDGKKFLMKLVKYRFNLYRILAIEAQSKAMRDERRKEEDEARGTKFGQEILDTDVYEENTGTNYLNYLPGNNEDVSVSRIKKFFELLFF